MSSLGSISLLTSDSDLLPLVPDVMSTPHPLKKWLERKAMSLEALSEVLQRKYDLKASPVYLETIAEGYYAPGKKLSLAISKETKISIEKLILFPYRAPRHSEAAS